MEGRGKINQEKAKVEMPVSDEAESEQEATKGAKKDVLYLYICKSHSIIQSYISHKHICTKHYSLKI